MWFSGKTNMASPKDLGMAIFSFFQQISTSAGNFVSSSINSVQQLTELRADYNKLADKLQVYEEKQSDIEQLRSENERLKVVLQFGSDLGYANTPSQIIGKDPGVLFNTFNKGYNHGVRKGMPVIAIQNGMQGLVGKIMAVSPVTSQVLPVFDSQNYIGARLEKSRYEGLVNGGGSSLSDLHMTYIDPGAKDLISVNDLVITSGLNSMYPPNLLIGKVTSILSKPYETSLEVSIHPFVEFSRIEYVYVLNYNSEVIK
jgi:rod shape-determining protein MreC